MSDEWDDRVEMFNDKPVRTTARGMVRVWLLLLLAVALVGAVGVGVWIFKVQTSDTKGQGDAEIIKNDARNRIRAQEGFWDRYQGIITADKNLSLTAEALAAKPGDAKLSTELTGQRMICNDLVGTYNSAARKFTQEEFRAAELPLTIDDADPATDCKENVK